MRQQPAFADGRIEGQVTGADNSTNLAGAQVRIDSLDRTVATGRDGRFSFGQVPAGNYTLVIEYLGIATEEANVSVQDNTTNTVAIVLGQTR